MHKISFVIGRTQFYFSRLCLPCTYFIKRGTGNVNKKPNENGNLSHGFRHLFGKYLCITNTVASAALMGLADLMQQEIENFCSGRGTHSYNWKRNVHMTEVGAVQGCFSHFFYMILDKYLPGTQFTTIAKKLAIDQVLFAPFCICFFFLGMQYLSNKDWEISLAELKEKFFLVYTVDCIVWVPTQFLNFYLLPPRFRVLCLSLVSVLYNMFLSFVKHNDVFY